MHEGLTSAEAEARLNSYGPNDLPGARRRDFGRILLAALSEPLLLLLVAASLIYFVIGDVHEAVLLMGLAMVNIVLVVYQEQKTERVLDSLRDLTSPRALVIRDGVRVRIAGREVVPGDLLVLAEGDRVPADGALIEAFNLAIDESLVTGESVPVAKAVGSGTADTEIAQVLSATLVVRGRGLALVEATGAQSEIGRIGKATVNIDFEKTRLHLMTMRLTRVMAVLGGMVSALVILFQGLRTQGWLAAGLAGITITMSMLPEEIPVVLTVFLTLGAWRLSRHNVLTRRAAAIETLGAATVLCTDKTGTLTVNRMAIARLWTEGETAKIEGQNPSLSEAMRRLLHVGALASEISPADPMEQAFHRLAEATGTAASGELVREYGLSAGLLAVTNVWRDGERYRVAAKGAPEAIAQICRLDETARTALKREVEAMAEDGLRVLGVAEAVHAGALPDDPHGFAFALCGLAGLADPLREAVPAAVAECHRAGVRVIMITGDYPATALAIARQAGIDGPGSVMTGAELETLDDATLAGRIRHVNVFARVRPEQKLRLVTALKADGEVVAMTGDGVNDAPALKAANIGIAMGGRGTDVAREAAALVLLDDAFESIVTAIRHGRRIFGNLRKALSYILAVHIPIAGLALVPLIAGWPIVFTPIHIVFLELIIDPVCSLAFENEPEGHDLMRLPPHAPSAPLFGRHEIVFGVLQGIVTLAAILAVFGLSLGAGADAARTIAFVTLVATNIFLVLTNRSWTQSLIESLWRPNTALWLIIAAAALFLTAALNVAYLRETFQFAALSADQLLRIAAATLAAALGMEAVKFTRRWLDGPAR